MKFVWRKLSLSCLFFILGCAGPQIFPAHPLVDQILKPRVGHDGKLTNRTCLKIEKDKCVEEKIVDYEIADPVFRKTANDFHFLCNIAGRRFKLCLDKPGFCRFSSETYRCGFLKLGKCSKRIEEYLPAEPYKYLIDAKVRCFKKETYPFDGV